MADAQAAKGHGASTDEQRGRLSRGSDPLVRAVGRLPAKVHTKLLIAFVGTSVLLVTVGLLGQRVLGQSNDRVVSLGALQQRSFAYGQLQRDASHVRALLAENAARDYYKIWTGGDPGPRRGSAIVALDQAVANDVARIGPATGVDRLGFTPPPDEAAALASIRRTADQLSALMTGIIGLETRGPPRAVPVVLRGRAEQLASDLKQAASVLANRTIAEIDDLIARNADSYEGSQALFIGVAVAALVLALVLGFALSGRWSARSRGSARAWRRSRRAISPGTSTS